MSVYLEDHPPARPQYRSTRRAQVTGAIVIHAAENTTDEWPPDGGAEGVAAFIARRTDGPGSYHTLVDSDSIVRVGRYEWEMFHEGTGGNRWSLGLSFACRASQWDSLPGSWITGALDQGARAAADMAAWVRSTVGIEIPPRRITPAQYRAGAAGFIGHRELDPGRRTDPGSAFPWGDFLALFANQRRPPMPTTEIETITRGLQQALNRLGYGLAEDGDPGPVTLGAALNAIPALDIERTNLKAAVAAHVRVIEEERRTAASTRERVAQVEAELEALADGRDPIAADVQAKADLFDRIAPNIIEAAELLAEMAAAPEVDRG